MSEPVLNNNIDAVDININIPFPRNKGQSNMLMKRYHDLQHMELEINSEKEKLKLLEENGIEKVFQQISKDEDQYNMMEENINSHLGDSSFDNEIDLTLLQNQIKTLHLLSQEQRIPDNLLKTFDVSKLAKNENSDQKDPLVLPNGSDFTKIIDSLNLGSIIIKNVTGNHGGNTENEIEFAISKSIASRIKYLEQLPSNIGSLSLDDCWDLTTKTDIPTNVEKYKLQAAVELKSLQLLTFQKNLRQLVIEKILNARVLKNSTFISSPIYTKQDRIKYIKNRAVVKHTSKLLEEIANQRKAAQYKKIVIKHKEETFKLLSVFANENEENKNTISEHKKKLIETNDFMRSCISISNYHQIMEREEQKRIERTAKQRLDALKMNDEEAYMKLIDQTKDTRITHLLRQTNTFLDSLAQAVKAQQKSQLTEPGVVDDSEEVTDDREKRDYYSAAHKIREKIEKQPTLLVGGTLKEYQLKGLEWMVSLYNNKLNGILADEMGLGKTIQSISLITYLFEFKKERSPFLVIVPLSTITNWTLEFEKWAPSLRTVVYKGTPNQRKEMSYVIRSGEFDVVLTTYEYVIRDKALLARPLWAHMIIDEGHRMKNSQSKLSFTLTTFYKTKNRLILTGTPLQNNLPELWALLNFVLPKIFKSSQTFAEWFNTPFANSGTSEKLTLTEEETLLIIRRLHMVLRPFLLRRLKKEVEKDLPDKVEKVVKCEMSAIQQVLYSQMAKYNGLYLGPSADASKKAGGVKGLNNRIMQLKKIVNHPFVFEEVEEILNPGKRWDTPLLIRTSGKFDLLDKVLDKFKATNHRCLIFFQMTAVMNIMEDFLRMKNMKYMRLDGSTKADERTAMLKEFNAPDSEYFCFLLSTRAGGLGLNLQTADTVIIFDSDWNPHQDLQAQDRAHRIGQKNEVRILRLITNDSVEEAILQKAHQKLDIDGKVIQAGKFNNDATNEERENFLKQLLDAESKRDMSQEANDKDKNDNEDEELNEMMARNEDERILFNKMDKERVERAIALAKEQGQEYPLPRLITKEELPAVFTEDVSSHFNKPVVEEIEGSRVKKRVRYDDGLSERQWLRAIDNEEDLEELIAKKEKRRRTASQNNGIKYNEDDSSAEDSDEVLEEVEDDIDNDNEFEVDQEEKDDEPAVAAEEEEEYIPKKRGRKRKIVVVEKEDEVEDQDLKSEPEKKVKRRGPPPKPKATKGGIEGAIIQYLIPALRRVKDINKTYKLADVFEVLPSKEDIPGYYKIIKNPISLEEITAKCLEESSSLTLDEVKEMFNRMFKNAKTFNEEDSWVHLDALTLESVVNKEWSKVKSIYEGNF
ncbi:hypothetical protein ACO0SA_001582 [Hanseniaspora valbyensis]